MANLDDLFEEKPAPTSQQVEGPGARSLDKLFADEPPSTGINDRTDKMQAQAGGAIRSGIQMAVPFGAGMAANAAFRTAPLIARYGADALAGLGAEGLLQATGISEQSPGMLAVSGAAGPTGRVLGSALAGLPKLIPGYTQAAKAGLVEHVRDLPGSVIAGGDSKALYDLVQGNLKAQLPQWPALGQAVAEQMGKGSNISWPALQKMVKGGPLEDLLTNIEQSLGGVPAQVVKQPVTGQGTAFGRQTGLPPQKMTIPAQPAGMTFEGAQANIEALNKAIRDSKANPSQAGALKDIKRAMLTDLENMQVPPGVPLQEWRAASEAYKAEKTRGLVEDVIEKNITSKEGIEMVNPDGILKALRVNKELQNRLSPAQTKELEKTLTDWAEASGGVKSKLGAMLAGMTIGGGPGGALAGWAGSEVVAKMLMSESARKLIGNLIARPTIGNFKRASSIFTATLRGAFDEPGPTPMPFEGQQIMPLERRTEPLQRESSAPVPQLPPLTTEDIKARVTKAAKDTKLDPKLFHAVVSTESNYNPMAISQAGAVGLTQLMPKTAAGMGVNPLDVDENLKGGGQYLQSLIKKYDGNVAKALAAYNAGPGRVDKGGPLPQETQDYVAKVLLKAGGKRDKERR